MDIIDKKKEKKHEGPSRGSNPGSPAFKKNTQSRYLTTRPHGRIDIYASNFVSGRYIYIMYT